MWTLLLSRLGDPPGTLLDRRQIDSGQMKIGRNAQSCDWVIADENGHISRQHCTISAVGLDLYVIDTSTNGIALNDPQQRVAPQMPVAIRVRDRLILGDYVIEVATQSAGAAASLMPPPPPPLPSSAGFSQPDQWFDTPADPVWGIGQHKAEVHDFLGDAMHDFLAPPKAAPMGGDPAWGGPLSDAFSKPILAVGAPLDNSAFAIPADWAAPSAPSASQPAAHPFGAPPRDAFGAPPSPFGGNDPFADFPPPPPPPSATATAAFPDRPLAPSINPFADSAPPPSIDPFADFAAPAPAEDPFAGFAPPPAAADDDPFAIKPASPQPAGDPFAGFGMAPPAAAPERTMFEPRPPAEPAAPPSVAPMARASAPAADDTPMAAASWAAFCEGAGLDPEELRTSPDAMRRLGVFYRQVVLGLSDLIQDRAAFKSEFRVERTQLSFGRNNPLKHLPPLDTAKLLLADPMPGFMPADDAVRSAFEDVKKHQLAMLAGVQHALTAVFERLSPAEIDRLIQKASGTKRSLPFSRGVNPWTVYQTVFEALRRDATSNVNSVMSVAFREGYESFLKSGS